MEEYYFLFVMALVWIVFAIFQDMKTREVANWLNFSLIAFVLAYRGFYSVWAGDVMFFVYGLFGVVIFIGLAYAFYYGRIFAGGDAKLLMGLGGVFPYQGWSDYLFYGIGFIFLLFLVGSFYSLIYSAFLIKRDYKNFVKEMKSGIYKMRMAFILAVLMLFIMLGISFVDPEYSYFVLFGIFIVLLPLFYIYAKSIEKSCMLKLVRPDKLSEGEWLVRDVKVGGKVIKKTVHGLSWEDIKVLRKAKKKVWVKEGVPFTPAFLIAIVIFVYVYLYVF